MVGLRTTVVTALLAALCLHGALAFQVELCSSGTTNGECNEEVFVSYGDNNYQFTDDYSCGADISVLLYSSASFALHVSDTSVYPTSTSFDTQSMTCTPMTCGNGQPCCKATIEPPSGLTKTWRTYYINIDVTDLGGSGFANVTITDTDVSCTDVAAILGGIAWLTVMLIICCGGCAIVGIAAGICYCMGAGCFAAASATRGGNRNTGRVRNPALQVNNDPNRQQQPQQQQATVVVATGYPVAAQSGIQMQPMNNNKPGQEPPVAGFAGAGMPQGAPVATYPQQQLYPPQQQPYPPQQQSYPQTGVPYAGTGYPPVQQANPPAYGNGNGYSQNPFQ